MFVKSMRTISEMFELRLKMTATASSQG